jgi:uncharacterized membrane protein YraQ (UPF0718 family)
MEQRVAASKYQRLFQIVMRWLIFGVFIFASVVLFISHDNKEQHILTYLGGFMAGSSYMFLGSALVEIFPKLKRWW